MGSNPVGGLKFFFDSRLKHAENVIYHNWPVRYPFYFWTYAGTVGVSALLNSASHRQRLGRQVSNPDLWR